MGTIGERVRRRWNLVVLVLLALHAVSLTAAPQAPSQPPIKVVVRMDQTRHSLSDPRPITVEVSLRNTGQSTFYVERRLWLETYPTGVILDLFNAAGNPIPIERRNPVLAPPYAPDDVSALVRLDPEHFYGTVFTILKNVLGRPGRYGVAARYVSWLKKESLGPQLRDLPASWDEQRELESDIVWFELTQ